MKPSFFKQIMVSALFACGLSADLPGVRKQAEGLARYGLPTVAPGAKAGGETTDHARRVAVCSCGLCDSHALSQPIWLSAPLAVAAPNPMALLLPSIWPMDGFGIQPMDRTCVRWDVPPSVGPEMNVPMDPLDTALCVPRYLMSLALQESTWPRPVGFGEPDQSLDVAIRAGRADMAAMIPRLKKVFAREGVPQQWVWMAEVESALNPRAKSSAGAAGLFQLMPGTARRFGLRTTPLDDRMEPEKSAGAAAQYLKFLRQEFGCWSLALAAYNAGEGRVKEIMKKRKALTFNEVERYLPSETRAYVPKVMALVALREDQLHGVPGAYWMP